MALRESRTTAVRRRLRGLGDRPIAPRLFERFASFEGDTIPALGRSRVITGDKLDLLERVREAYSGFDEEELSLVSREPGGPWEQARGNIHPIAACSNVLIKKAIGEFYGQKIENG